jgi:hypothetical protein
MTTSKNPLAPFHRVIALLLLVAGCPFIAVGLYESNKVWQELGAFDATRGTVVDNVYQTIQREDRIEGAYHPVVEFEARETIVRFTDGVGSLPPDYEVGAQVDVLYNPNNARDARIDSWKRLWLAPTLLTSVGALPLLIYLAARLILRRSRT